MTERPRNVSRRQFLSASLATSISAATCGRAAAKGRSTPLRLACLGLGDRGRHLLAAVRKLEGIRVTALCDLHPDRLARAVRLFGGRSEVRGVAEAEHLLEGDDFDAVLIATPVDLHHRQSLAALAAGKHVYCEKPLALTPEECREVREAARSASKRGQIYQSGLQRRYNPRYRASLDCLERLERGEAIEVLGAEARDSAASPAAADVLEGGGPVRFVRAQWHAMSAARPDKPWLWRRERSGDIILEQACHQFDIFNWVLGGPPLHAIGLGLGPSPEAPPGGDVLDQYSVTLQYPGGAQAMLSHLTFSVPDRRFSGIYELAFGEGFGVDLPGAHAWNQRGRTVQLTREGGSDTQLALAAFARACETGEPPAADVEAAYQATLAALTCRRAIESKTLVSYRDVESS